ncbi:MAG TPA: HYR domain-containing protein, partial [Thermoanaerobaculia bacterium]|nr:HYR domain-containing protein [Thermoanaerobaculia bacterium]
QIRAYSSGGGACGTLAATGDDPPVPNAGPDYSIPQSTPFTLTGSGNDPNGDTLTYAWEQYDLGPGIGQPTPTYSGPLFRSYPDRAVASRTFPPMSALISGAATPWEVLPGSNRDLTFRLTVRDNHGGSDYDTTVVHVNGAPFRITGPSGSVQCGMPSTLTWQVGGSTDPNVQALMSTNNGGAFPVTLLGSTPNDGSAPFNVPQQTLTNQAWIRLAPLGNIDFALQGPLSIVDTLAPAVTAPANLSHIECTQCSPRGASPAIGAATATDACDTTLSISSNAPAVFPLGTTNVTWSGRDDSNNIGTAVQTVQVVDTTPPTIAAPASVTAECTGPSGTPVPLGTPAVGDVCWCSQVTVGNNAPAVFTLGTTTVTWQATDGSGNSSTAVQNVTIQDTTPPDLSVSVSPAVLWPANHKLVAIHADIAVSDICDSAPTVTLVAITSSEPDNGLGDGDTPIDVQGAAFGTDDRDFLLRAERSGLGIGRTYTITYQARDASSNITVKEVTVSVPRSQR